MVLWAGGDALAGAFAWACAFATPGSKPIINSGPRRKNASAREIHRMKRPNRAAARCAGRAAHHSRIGESGLMEP